MNWKDYVKQIVASRPDITPKHGLNMNRRELFAQGYIATGSMIAMPSLLSLVSMKAQGAEDLCRAIKAENSNKTAVLIIDGAGGWQITGRNVIVGGAGGQTDFLPVGSYKSIGLMPAAEPTSTTNTNSEYGLMMQMDSFLLEGLNLGATAPTRAQVDGRVYCVRSGDDSSNNPHNPAFWLRAAGADGSVVSILGTADTPFGGRALESARLKNKNLQVIVFTDGSTSCSGMGNNDDARGFYGPTNDSGTRSSVFSLTYSAGAKTEMRDGKLRQAGQFNSTGAVENVQAFSDAPAIAAELLLADYLALHEEDLTKVAQSVEKIAGKNTLGAKLSDHIGYKKLA